jgi:hypothetical protein
MRSGCVWAIGIGVFLVFTILMLGLPGHLALLLIAGWFLFLRRTLPEVQLDVAALAFGGLCLALLVVGLHRFCGWFYRESQESKIVGGLEVSAPSTVRSWPVRWTLASVFLLLLMFTAGMAATGIAHQVGWLMSGREPLLGASYREAMRRAQSINDLRQIGLGLWQYDEMNGSLPAGGTFDTWGRGMHSWQTQILPHVEQRALYEQIDLSLPWNHPRNQAAMRAPIQQFRIPGDERLHDVDAEGFAVSDYAANLHVMNGGVPNSIASMTDGASNTLLAGQVAIHPRPWGDPRNWRDPALGINHSPEGFGSPFRGGAQMVFVDGSVKFIRDSTNRRVLRMLATPRAGDGPGLESDWVDP